MVMWGDGDPGWDLEPGFPRGRVLW